MNRLKHCIVVAALIGVPGCMTDVLDEEESLGEQEVGSDPFELGSDWNISEDAQLDEDSDEVSISADCVFIEWCNRPASISPNIGTVCRVRSGCAFPPTGAIVNECTGDAVAVCGGITQEAWICRAGRTCPPG